MVVCNDTYVWPNHDTIINSDASSSHARQRVVYKHALADFHLTGKVDLNGRHEIARLIEIAAKEFLFQRTNLLRLWSRSIDLKQMLAQSVICLMASAYSGVAISTSAPELN